MRKIFINKIILLDIDTESRINIENVIVVL